MNQTVISELTVGEIVTRDFRTAKIFKNVGIDFCCGGKQGFQEACLEKGIDQNELIRQFEQLDDSNNFSHNFKEWDLVFLIDYIVNTHHRFVLKNLPELLFYTDKIASVHGDNHTELIDIANMIKAVNTELTQHLKNEEEVLFPAIKSHIESPSEATKSTIRSEITRMLGEHDFAGGTMDKINVISKGYLVPEDGCNTYKVAYKMLEQFEDDLHTHVHLENNILFPKALELAK